MTKLEFLDQLRNELQGNMEPSAVNSNIDYYDSYIKEEMDKGMSEEEILQSLGDPWVIAQTILNVDNSMGNAESYDSSAQAHSSYNTRASESVQNPWWKKLLIILVVVMVVLGIFSIGIGLIRLLAPIALPVLIVVFVVRLMKGGKS